MRKQVFVLNKAGSPSDAPGHTGRLYANDVPRRSLGAVQRRPREDFHAVEPTNWPACSLRTRRCARALGAVICAKMTACHHKEGGNWGISAL